MTQSPTRRPALFVALFLILGACSGGTAETTTTLATTTTTLAPTTTTTLATTTTRPQSTTTLDPNIVTIAPEGFRSPVNGLQPEFDSLIDRRAISVKIDNHPEARPQSGLQEADGVIELLVEGGFTRFIAVFHTSDTDYLGPVRSLRPTDSTLLAAIPSTLATSGGQEWVRELTATRGIALIGESTVGMFRISGRVAPHNLYADTTGIRKTADARGYSDETPQWLYKVGEWRIPDTPATEVVASWSSTTTVTWKYVDGVYERWLGSAPHRYRTKDGDLGTVTAEVLVILAGREYTMYSHLATGSPVPATNTVGTDKAYVISRGAVWEGTWTRDQITDQYILLNEDGSEAFVPPGKVWVMIFPNHRTLSIS